MSRTIGWAGWLRRHMFRNAGDSALTLIVGAGAAYVLLRLARYVFVTGRWEIVEANLVLFMVGGYDRAELWRPAAALIVIGAICGLVAGIVARRQHEAAEGPPAARRPWVVVRDLLTRFWPALIGAVLVLTLTDTITPTVITLAAAAAGLVARLIGFRLPKRALPLIVALILIIAVVMILILVEPQGWDSWGGLMLNLYLAAVSITLCFPLGVLLALGRRSQLPIIRWLSTLYIEVFRGVPLIALLLMANVALGFFIPQSLAPGKVVRAIVVFVLFTAAYVAEIVRGGLQSLPMGQLEAGRSLGLSPVRITLLIILPQALRNVIPALVGQFISLFKDTTLAGAAMGFIDLLSGAEAATAQEAFRGQRLFAETVVFVSFLFWIGSYTMSKESQRIEKKLGVGQR